MELSGLVMRVMLRRNLSKYFSNNIQEEGNFWVAQLLNIEIKHSDWMLQLWDKSFSQSECIVSE